MSLIDAILPLASNPTAGSAEVAAVNADGTVDITVGGANVPAGCAERYTDPAVGDVVITLPVPGGYVVIDRFRTS